MSAELARLPVTVVRASGEAIDGYLERLAAANGMDHPILVRRISAGGARTTFLTTAPDPQLSANVAALTAMDAAVLDGGALAAMPGVDVSGLDPAERATWRTVASRGWPPEHGTALCPVCLVEDGVWRIVWRHPWVSACVRHGSWLAGTCPNCRQRFRTHRTPLRPVDAAWGTCGNPAGVRGRNCSQPLTEIRTDTAPPAVLEAQGHIDTAIAGGPITVVGQQAEPTEYLAELKALTVLLLHLATQDGADEVATWASDARADRGRSAAGGGVRWGLAPPADLRLRGEALAAADAILRQPDAETAADALHPWTELTPACNEGQLGWLADHTAMTPTLTGLVMAATASRRRVATLLDHAPPHQPVDLPAAAIPQVLPATLYDRHLDGMLAVRPKTSRLFTSLCLSRRHTAAGSWAEAATTLGLPSGIGVNTARACSADLLVRADRFVKVLDDLTGQLDAGVDYRSREAVVRSLASTARWYRRWARIYRPGSRATSSGYAVTWLWTEYAHGHIDTSPGWQQPPDHTDRARFRRYAKRLSADATNALLEIAVATASQPRRRIA